ncbi:MAG: acyl-CoA dehydrogenase family protein [Burkholderiales bacterium]
MHNAAIRKTSEHATRAKAIAGDLAKGALETIAARKLIKQSVGLIREAGLIKVLQPKRCGGWEASLHDHIDVVEEVAYGCGSTGWCLGVYQAHSWLLGSFDVRAQDDVYGANPNAIVSAVIGPRGQARKVPGGYKLSGFWPFCSGCHHSDWVLLGEMVMGDDDAVPDSGVMVIPTKDVNIQDDWYTGGLTGTGSNSVTVKDLFVPEHRFLSVPAAIEGKTPGAHVHGTSLYRSAAVPVLALFICSAALGMSRRALDNFIKRMPGRIVAYTFGDKQADLAVTHIEVAEAATKLDAARLLLHGMVDEVEAYANQGEQMPLERRAKARMDCAYAVRLCLESTQTLYIATGGSGLDEKSPIHLAQKDLHAINMHGLLSMKTNLEMYGRVLLGMSPNSPVV